MFKNSLCFLFSFDFFGGTLVPMSGLLLDTGVASEIRDWNIVMDSMIATPKKRKQVIRSKIPVCKKCGKSVMNVEQVGGLKSRTVSPVHSPVHQHGEAPPPKNPPLKEE